MQAHPLVRVAAYGSFLASVLLGAASPTHSQIAQGPSVPPEDSVVARIVSQVVNDSLARLRDSIRSGSLSPNHLESSDDGRPAREVLRAIDPSLFAATSGTVGDDYPLGPGDELVINIWGQKQAQYTLLVERDGQIIIPSAGSLSLNGVNFGEARRLVGRKLSAIYSGIGSGTTQFDLSLGKLKQIRVFVVGEVARPGGYTLQGATSTMQAVALAGGPTARGSDRIAIVTNGSKPDTVDLYQYLFLGRRPAGDLLRDGSVVRVPVALGTARVRGGAARPGHYEVLPGETTTSLLEIAGGPSAQGARGEPMNLVRVNGNSTSAILVGTKAAELGGSPISPVGVGDVLEVPLKTSPRRGSPVIAGAVARPGTYPWSDGLTVKRLVELAGGTVGTSYLHRVVVFRTDARGQTFVLSTSLSAPAETPLQFSDSVVVGEVSEVTDSTRTVSITGAVRIPTTVVWSSGLRVKDMVVLAGGWLPWADPTQVRVDLPTPDGKGSTSKTISLDTALGIGAQDFALPGAAAIHVPGEQASAGIRRVAVQGLVVNPGPQTLLSAKEKVAAVVARAGGLRPEAYASGATLHRPSEGRIPFDLSRALKSPNSDDNVVLRDGDSLHVPHVPATVRVEGQVQRPTTTLWRKGKDWEWYIQNAGGLTDSAMRKGIYVVYADGSMSSYKEGLDDPTPGSVVVVPRKDPPPPSTTVEKISAFGSIAAAIGTLITAYAIYLSATK